MDKQATIWASLDAAVQADPALPAAQERDFQFSWQSEPAGQAGSAFPLRRTLTLHWRALPPVPAAAQLLRLPLVDREAEVRLLGQHFWVEGKLHLNLARPDAATLTLNPGPVDQEVLMLAMTELHRSGGWLPLHAAVVARQGRAVALVGPSGTGKSTAALRLAELGLEVLAEDRAWWHAESGMVIGLDRHLRAFDDSLERFAPTRLAEAARFPRDPKGKALLPLAAALPAQLVRVLALSAEAGAAAGQPLSGAERVRLVWETTGTPLTETARQQGMSAVQRLLPLVFPRMVSREQVTGQVMAALDATL